jgi:hypothetical protein
LVKIANCDIENSSLLGDLLSFIGGSQGTHVCTVAIIGILDCPKQAFAKFDLVKTSIIRTTIVIILPKIKQS